MFLAALKLGQDLDDDLYASFDAGIQTSGSGMRVNLPHSTPPTSGYSRASELGAAVDIDVVAGDPARIVGG